MSSKHNIISIRVSEDKREAWKRISGALPMGGIRKFIESLITNLDYYGSSLKLSQRDIFTPHLTPMGSLDTKSFWLSFGKFLTTEISESVELSSDNKPDFEESDFDSVSQALFDIVSLDEDDISIDGNELDELDFFKPSGLSLGVNNE